MSSKGGSRKCSFRRQDGRACRAWAIRSSDPPRCAAHRQAGGVPVGHETRQSHDFYTVQRPAPGAQPVRDLRDIDDVVEDMMLKQARLSAFIEEQISQGTMPLKEAAKLLALHGQNASRIGRLLRDQRALSGKSVDGLLEAIGAALDELSTELGIEL